MLMNIRDGFFIAGLIVGPLLMIGCVFLPMRGRKPGYETIN